MLLRDARPLAMSWRHCWPVCRRTRSRHLLLHRPVRLADTIQTWERPRDEGVLRSGSGCWIRTNDIPSQSRLLYQSELIRIKGLALLSDGLGGEIRTRSLRVPSAAVYLVDNTPRGSRSRKCGGAHDGRTLASVALVCKDYLRLERPARIELACPAWKAVGQPLTQGRERLRAPGATCVSRDAWQVALKHAHALARHLFRDKVDPTCACLRAESIGNRTRVSVTKGS